MKKLVFATIFSFAAVAAVVSCNNGPYDAHPDTDLSSGLNPVKPDSGGVNVYLGTMEAFVNNRTTLFSPAFYYIDDEGKYNMVARVKDDTVFERTLRMKFFDKYNGVDSYRINVDSTYPAITFTMVDTSRVDGGGRKVYNSYGVIEPEDYGGAIVIGEEGGNIRGTFYGRLSRFAPEELPSDTVNISAGEFYFQKYPFPLPEGVMP